MSTVYQSVSEADIEAVVRVLRSDRLTQGPEVPAFEKSVTHEFGSRYAVAVNSATSALHIACLALGVGPGDTVWTSPTTFVASANCARYCGADVDFVDINPKTWCLCVDRLEEKLKSHVEDGLSMPKVVIPVHLAGQSCDMEKIAQLAHNYGFYIIEDASHAMGGTYRGSTIGSCRYGDITIFSFHPVKIITTGEGGMALTNNPELHQRMACLRTHGITRDTQHMTCVPDGAWYYEQHLLGFNYRMTEMQGALGCSQLQRLREFVVRRNEIAQRYDEDLSTLPVQRQYLPQGVYSARHLYIIRVNGEQHSRLFDILRSKGIDVNLHYIPVHLQPYYRNLGFSIGQFPEAETYGQEAISLPLYFSMDIEQQRIVVETLKQVLE